VGASLEVMDRDARKMRGDRPFIFAKKKPKDWTTLSVSSSAKACWKPKLCHRPVRWFDLTECEGDQHEEIIDGSRRFSAGRYNGAQWP
jgi:hypothetical protein